MSQKPTSDGKKSKDADGVKHPLIRSYGRRWSKGLRPTRASALESVMAWASLEFPSKAVDPATFFDTPVKQVWFEIGFGNGEHILQQGINHPDVGLIGCEPFMNGVAALCVGISEKNVKNVRIWPNDARLLMEKMKPASLDRLFLLHPDPWPKTRHHKRRFLQTETLDEIARLLKPGAEFRMATDHVDLSTWLLDKTYHHPAFEWTAKEADDWRTPPEDWPETRYGKKGLKQGRPPVYFIFRRI